MVGWLGGVLIHNHLNFKWEWKPTHRCYIGGNCGFNNMAGMKLQTVCPNCKVFYKRTPEYYGSLLDNAPNYLVGCVIQKRYTSFQDCHVYDKGGFTGASRCNFYATKAWNLNNCENSSSNSTTVSNLMIKSRAGSCTYKWIEFIWSLPVPPLPYFMGVFFSWNQFHEKFHEVDFT